MIETIKAYLPDWLVPVAIAGIGQFFLSILWVAYTEMRIRQTCWRTCWFCDRDIEQAKKESLNGEK